MKTNITNIKTGDIIRHPSRRDWTYRVLGVSPIGHGGRRLRLLSLGNAPACGSLVFGAAEKVEVVR